MGNVLRRSEEVQRRANKAFADPRTWKRTQGIEQRSSDFNLTGNRFNQAAAERHSIEQLVHSKSHINADEFAAEMDRIEKEHRSKNSVNPEEVTMALRMNLYQQRQYLSYKDTMQRMGVPQTSILTLDKWSENHSAPMDEDLKDIYHSYSDRIFSLDLVQNPDADPNDHDSFAAIEEGDNRLTERMMMELCMLRQEGKIDYDAAGRELNRDPEVLRRVTAAVRIPPPLTDFDPNVDPETMFQLMNTGKRDQQSEVYRRGLKNIFRGGGQMSENYFHGGWAPEDIPVHGFQSPREKFNDPMQRGTNYAEHDTTAPYNPNAAPFTGNF